MSSQNLDSDVIETRHSFKDDVSIIEISSSDTSPETPSPRVSQSRYSTKYSAGRVPLIQTVTPLSHQSSSRKRKAQSPCNIDALFTEIFDESRDEDYIPTQLSPIRNISRRQRKNIESVSFTEIINSEDEDFVPTQPYTQPKMPSKKRKSRLRKMRTSTYRQSSLFSTRGQQNPLTEVIYLSTDTDSISDSSDDQNASFQERIQNQHATPTSGNNLSIEYMIDSDGNEFIPGTDIDDEPLELSDSTSSQKTDDSGEDTTLVISPFSLPLSSETNTPALLKTAIRSSQDNDETKSIAEFHDSQHSEVEVTSGQKQMDVDSSSEEDDDSDSSYWAKSRAHIDHLMGPLCDVIDDQDEPAFQNNVMKDLTIPEKPNTSETPQCCSSDQVLSKIENGPLSAQSRCETKETGVLSEINTENLGSSEINTENLGETKNCEDEPVYHSRTALSELNNSSVNQNPTIQKPYDLLPSQVSLTPITGLTKKPNLNETSSQSSNGHSLQYYMDQFLTQSALAPFPLPEPSTQE